jgi:hypothetical protein
MFIASMGSIASTGTATLKAQQGQQSNMSDAADLEGTGIAIVDTDDNRVVVLDLWRPRERYVRPAISRSTANVAIDSVVAVQYAGAKAPVGHDTTVLAAEYHVSPPEGTA